MSDNRFIVCMSVEELPQPYVASDKDRCIDCGRDVWVSKALRKERETIPCICLRCANKRVAKSKDKYMLVLTDKVQAEIIDIFKKRTRKRARA